jgi:hypothetical protein
MHKGAVAYVIAIIVIIALALIYTGTKFLGPASHTTITVAPTTTSSTVPVTVGNTTTINLSNSVSPCASFQLVVQQFNNTYTTRCISSGGTLGLWVAAGNSGTEHVTIVGADGVTYIDQSSTYNCTAFYQNFSTTPQIYTITFTTGLGGGSCGNPSVIINQTTTPPKLAYNYIYNGNFGNGEYTGWNASGAGFGNAPFNLTYQNNASCYQGQPWAGYNGTYFATTYNCGISAAPGNLTSSLFIVNPTKPFLNFRIISPQDDGIYVAVLRNNTPIIVAHFNTYNISLTSEASSTFENVSIPLIPYINQALRVKVVDSAINKENYVAIGDFVLSHKQYQQKGVATSIQVNQSGS